MNSNSTLTAIKNEREKSEIYNGIVLKTYTYNAMPAKASIVLMYTGK